MGPAPATIRAMQPTVLQASLYERIPLSRAMDVTVLEADPERVVLRAPLAPNIDSVLECAGTRVGGLNGEFAVIPT